MNLLTSLVHLNPRRSARRRCPLEVEGLGERASPTTMFYSIDGTGNNLTITAWGSAGTDLLRIAPAAYADGVSAPAGAGLPNARLISNVLSDQTDPTDPSQDVNTINQKLL